VHSSTSFAQSISGRGLQCIITLSYISSFYYCSLAVCITTEYPKGRFVLITSSEMVNFHEHRPDIAALFILIYAANCYCQGGEKNTHYDKQSAELSAYIQRIPQYAEAPPYIVAR
jgi:hypothetical protein